MEFRFKEKDTLELDIIDQNYDGLGVSKVDGYTIFVSGAIIGERVKAKIDRVGKSYGESHVTQVLKRSKYRVEPKCPYFPKCGGCSLLHMSYQSTLLIKKNAFIETLKRIGGVEVKIEEVIGMDCENGKTPQAFRNKIQMPVAQVNGKLICGYYEKETHNVISIDKCLSQSDNVTDLIKYVKNICNDYKVTCYDESTHKGQLRHILVRENYLGELMLVLIVDEKIKAIDEICEKVKTKFSNVVSVIENINKKKNNVILGDESITLYGKDELIDCVLDTKYRLSHMSFFQVNREQTNKLYSKVLEYLEDGKNNVSDMNVIDGYCGVGSISLALAKKVKRVYGIEVVEEAIDDAKMNAKINEINNVEFYCDKVEDKISELIDNDIDCVVIDPPRKGVEASVLNSLIENKIKKIIYVSCNPATLARDLSILKEYYRVDKISLVDMFCYSSGIESIVCLVRK